MWKNRIIYKAVIILLGSISIEAGVRLVPEDSEFFVPCQGKTGVVPITDRFDLSGVTFEYKDDGIEVSGDAVVTWDIKETDRVEVTFKIIANLPNINNFYQTYLDDH